MTVYEVVLNGQQDAEPMLSALHYDVTGSTDFQALSDAIKAEIQTGLQAQIVNSVVWSGITVRVDTPGSVGVTYPFTGGDVIGSNAETSYAANVAALVRKYSDGITRPTQGRIFQGGIPITSLDSDGKLRGANVADLTAAWELLRVVEFDGVGEAVMQIKATNPSAPNTVAYNTVARLATAFRLSTQKRRNWST